LMYLVIAAMAAGCTEKMSQSQAVRRWYGVPHTPQTRPSLTFQASFCAGYDLWCFWMTAENSTQNKNVAMANVVLWIM
jgi:hypothetical protein